MKLYKLTDENDQTRNNTQWGENITHEADGASKDLCNGHWIHAYQNPILAVLMNPAHGDFENPHLWICKGKVGLKHPDKIGCTKLTTVKRIELPLITDHQIRRFAVLVALEVCPLWKEYDKDSTWKKWADDFLKGNTDAANNAANNAARVAARVAAHDAAYNAARAAARAAHDVANNVADATYAAAYATGGDATKRKLNLVKLAQQAMETQ